MPDLHQTIQLEVPCFLKEKDVSQSAGAKRREFPGMIQSITINFIIPATPSNPSSHPAHKLCPGFQHLILVMPHPFQEVFWRKTAGFDDPDIH